ncbi:hypothetical protein CFB3_27680 [Clostridium folliculivorans]|uniref:Uncharacterized protein n=1 Tax=Clostridium folliculivorans TaxID=2886038 RepID=A0A9W5Y0W6_9CLOT|nr:hypothetical protein CFOLD11_13890 [Clostridium folliculivorans]GKU30661.1 hypothetical protein CFB3_27680 [Clostridium folliculivorans]
MNIILNSNSKRVYDMKSILLTNEYTIHKFFHKKVNMDVVDK